MGRSSSNVACHLHTKTCDMPRHAVLHFLRDCEIKSPVSVCHISWPCTHGNVQRRQHKTTDNQTVLVILGCLLYNPLLNIHTSVLLEQTQTVGRSDLAASSICTATSVHAAHHLPNNQTVPVSVASSSIDENGHFIKSLRFRGVGAASAISTPSMPNMGI